MSYDLLAFKPGVPPMDRSAFIAWFAQVVRLRDGHLSPDPSSAEPSLAAWYRDMSRIFPSLPTLPRGKADAEDELMGADYRFGPHVVFVRLDWRLSRKAQTMGLKFARTHMVGLFDASGERAQVWTVNLEGIFQLAHRGETILPEDRLRERA